MLQGGWIGFALLALLGSAALGAAERPQGYLAPGEFDVSPVLEPAPRSGEPRYAADRRIFKATRKLAGTPRYALATSDARLGPADLLKDFSCAVGVELTQANAPRLLAVAQRADVDTSIATGRAKEFYRRDRPFVIDHGRICQPEAELYDTAHQRMSYDYPSGHTTRGWTWSLILAALAPDRAQQILQRGRVYGDSRYICGAHNESAVEAGFLSASATMAVVATKAAYQADLAEARTELAHLRAAGAPAATGCTEEAREIASYPR